MEVPDEILKGPDYFYCNNYRITMKKSQCVENQLNKSERMGCDGCDPGQAITEELSGSKSTPTTCSAVDCDELVVARGWCETHYNRWVSGGRKSYSTKKAALESEPEVKSTASRPDKDTDKICEKTTSTPGLEAKSTAPQLAKDTAKTCKIVDCDKPASIRGLCDSCRWKWKKGKRPELGQYYTVQVKNAGETCKIKDCDKIIRQL